MRFFGTKNALLLYVVMTILLIVPSLSYAAGDTSADTQCNPVILQCGCGQVMQNGQCTGGANKWQCPCVQTDNGFPTAGICVAPNKCLAQSTGGKSPDQGLSQLGQILGQLLSKLGQAAGGGSGSSPTTGTTGCTTSYYYTSNTSLIGVDPCALYQPSTATTCTDPTATNYGAAASCTYSCTNTTASNYGAAATCTYTSTSTTSTTGTTASLSASPSSGPAPLLVTFTTSPVDSTQTYTVEPGDGGNNVSLSSNGCSSNSSSTCVFGGSYTYNTAGTYTVTLLNGSGVTVTTVSISVVNPGGSSGTGLSQTLSNIGNFLTGSSSPAAAQSSNGLPGVFGNLILSQNGATIFASTINSANNSETTGFYGGATLGQSQNFGASLCQGRPWASNALADLIPPSFFDSVCQWAGYEVGTPPPQTQPQVTLSQKPAQTAPPPATTTAPTTPAVPAQAVIWAVPSSVPLGARTSIFWNTQGVTSCTESSPDGSFSDNTLSGAAATVPITGATTFSISCVDPNGNPVTDYVTVELSN